jgi:hypothetical protein
VLSILHKSSRPLTGLTALANSRRTTYAAQSMSRVQAQVQVLSCLVQVRRGCGSSHISRSIMRAAGALHGGSCLLVLAKKYLRHRLGWGRRDKRMRGYILHTSFCVELRGTSIDESFYLCGNFLTTVQHILIRVVQCIRSLHIRWSHLQANTCVTCASLRSLGAWGMTSVTLELIEQ